MCDHDRVRQIVCVCLLIVGDDFGRGLKLELIISLPQIVVLVVVTNMNSPAHIALRVALIIDNIGRAHIGRPLDNSRLTVETRVLENGPKLGKRVVCVGASNVICVDWQPSAQPAR